MIFDINLRKLPSQYGEVSVMCSVATDTLIDNDDSSFLTPVLGGYRCLNMLKL